MKPGDYRKEFQKFRGKLILETALRSAVSAFSSGALGVFLWALVFRILGKETDLQTAGMLVLHASLLPVLILLFWRRYPTEKRIAERLDEAGLFDRAVTLYEFRFEESGMAALQREDAIKHIREVEKSRLKRHFRVREGIIALLAAVLCGTALWMPRDLFSFNSSAEQDPERLRQEEIASDLIEKLREEIKKAKNDRDLEENLLQCGGYPGEESGKQSDGLG